MDLDRIQTGIAKDRYIYTYSLFKDTERLIYMTLLKHNVLCQYECVIMSPIM